MHTHECLSQMEDSASHDKLNKNMGITTILCDVYAWGGERALISGLASRSSEKSSDLSELCTDLADGKVSI